MVKLPIVVFHSGQWNDEQCYIDYQTIGVLVEELMDFESFVKLIQNELQHNSPIELSVLLNLGNTGVQHIVKILEDKDISWFFTVVKNDHFTKYPLVVHVVDTLLEVSVGSYSSAHESVSGGELEVFKDFHVDNMSSALPLKEKDLFGNKEILLKSFQFIAVKNNFEFRIIRSNSKSIELICSQDGCQWFLRALRYKHSELWMIRKYICEHNCSMMVRSSHKQASSQFISDCMIESFRYSYNHSTPKDIVHHIRMNYGVSVSYYKALRAKESIMKLLKGDASGSYDLIPKFFLKLKEMNPGTFTEYEVDSNGHFKYCFMAMGSSIEGWTYCRPNISVDGIFLKCKFAGTLLTASTMDGNSQLFPLAFGIVDSENDASWTWFFKKLKICFRHREGLVLVSDRHINIAKSFLNVFPSAKYCVCIEHLLNNLKLSFKDSMIDKLFRQCAKSYTIDDFELNMRWMESIYPSIREYLRNVGFERWARAYSKQRRYQMLTTNISECLNSVLKNDRNLPVASLLDAIRELLQEWFYERSKLSSSLKSILTKWAEGEMRKQVEISRSFIVFPISEFEHQVLDEGKTFLVKLNYRSCTCRVWDLEEIPCSHALAVIHTLDLNPYSFVLKYYFASTLASTYNGVVRPIGNHHEWSIVAVNNTILPPVVKHPAGRPRKQRIPSSGELGKRNIKCKRCTRCKGIGHNKRTCKNQPI